MMPLNSGPRPHFPFTAKLTGPEKRRFHICLSVLIASVVLGFSLFYRLAIGDILYHSNRWWLLAGLMGYGVNYLLRACRLRILAGHQINFWPQSLYICSLHGFLTYLTPFQIGDASLPIILKASHGTNLMEGGAILIRARLLDMMGLGAVMLLAAAMVDLGLDLYFRLIWAAIGGGFLVAPFVLRFLIAGKWLQSKRIGRLIKAFSKAGAFKIGECLISFGIWIAVAIVFYCVVKSINLPIGFGGVVLVIAIQLPLQVIPVQGLANTGNHEGGWIVALSLFGIPIAKSAEFAVTSHIIILLYVLALGIFAVSIGPKITHHRPG